MYTWLRRLVKELLFMWVVVLGHFVVKLFACIGPGYDSIRGIHWRRGPVRKIVGPNTYIGGYHGLEPPRAVLAGIGEIFFSSCKVIPMIIIPLLALKGWKGDHIMQPIQGSAWPAINAASGLTFWGFVGLEAGTTLANCVENSRVIVPRALFFGLYW